MGALAKDTTLHSVLEGLTGAEPERTAKVITTSFDSSQFESGRIDTSDGTNRNGSGFYRTKDYISLQSNKWMGQLYTNLPIMAYILYYDAEKNYTNEYDQTYTGYCKLKNYTYCRIYFYKQTDYIDTSNFISTCLKIQYITQAPAEKEYFLHNHLFNGNFEYDRNEDGVGDGWTLQNSPSNSSVSDNTQIVTPCASNYFIQFTSDNRLTGHVIYVAFTAYTQYASVYLSVYGTSIEIGQNTKYTRKSQNITAVNSSTNLRASIASGGVAHPVYLRNVMMIDLTEIYGSGNEPTASQIDEIIDTFYNGYVPCEYVVKYDDRDAPSNVLKHLQNIENVNSATDEIIISNGEVSTIKHYVGGALQSTSIVNRDMFGNIISIEEV